jgi:hypothetical protein
LLGLVVAGQAVDTGLNENETELGVLVLAVDLEVLADGDGLLDEVPQVLRDRGGEAWATISISSKVKLPLSRTIGLQDTKDFVAGYEADLGDAMGVTEGDADLGGGQALTSELDDVVDDILGSRLEPGGGSAAVGEGRGR